MDAGSPITQRGAKGRPLPSRLAALGGVAVCGPHARWADTGGGRHMDHCGANGVAVGKLPVTAAALRRAV